MAGTAPITSAQDSAPLWDRNTSVPLVVGLPDPSNVRVPQIAPITVQQFPIEPFAGEQQTGSAHLGPDGRLYLQEENTWTIVPTGIIYRSYYAGLKEPRMGAVIDWDSDGNNYFDGTIGGRFGLIRYGNTDGRYPQGWQLDIEGAVFPRLNFDEDRDLENDDFRVGVPLTYGQGPVQLKLAYYHISAHVGDEFLLRNPTFKRKNYVRDGLAFGVSYEVEAIHMPIEAHLYAEADWSINTIGGAEPWEFQFGIEMLGMERGPRLYGSVPFLAVGGHLREEVDFGGNFVLQGGLLWHAADTTSTLRLGIEYVNGKNIHYEMFKTFEQRFGLGLWYDY